MTKNCILCVKLAIYVLCIYLTTNYTLYTEQQFTRYVQIYPMIIHLYVKVVQQHLRLYVNLNNNYTLCVKAAQYLMQNV